MKVTLSSWRLGFSPPRPLTPTVHMVGRFTASHAPRGQLLSSHDLSFAGAAKGTMKFMAAGWNRDFSKPIFESGNLPRPRLLEVRVSPSKLRLHHFLSQIWTPAASEMTARTFLDPAPCIGECAKQALGNPWDHNCKLAG